MTEITHPQPAGPPATPVDGEGNGADAVDGHGPRPRSRRRNTVVVLLGAVLLLLAAGGGVWSHGRSSEAARARAEVVSMDQRRVQLSDQAHQDQTDQLALETAAADVNDALNGLNQSTEDAIAAQNRFVDLANQCATLLDRGRTAPAQDLMRTKGAPALADLEQKVSILDTELDREKAKAQHLQEVTR